MEGRSTIKFTISDNGIIKEITDFEVNGTNKKDEYLYVYEFTGKSKTDKEKVIDFLNDLIDELDLPVGKSNEMNVVSPHYIRGKNFEPDIKFLEDKIENLNKEIENTQQIIKQLKES